jgi:hypothetical protein
MIGTWLEEPMDSNIRSKRAAGNPRTLNYAFDPVPKAAADLVATKALKGIDTQVLTILLRYRSRLRDSCWTTIPRLAAGVGRTDRTVQSALRRLTLAGLIRHVAVGIPDPDEPRNRTGWRFYFAFMDESPASRAGAHARSLGEIPFTPPVQEISPPGCNEFHPPGETDFTQANTERIPSPSGGGETKDDDDQTGESSSSLSSIDPEEMPSQEELERQAALLELIPIARGIFPDVEDGQVRDVVEVHGDERVHEVLCEIQARMKRNRGWKPETWGYMRNTLRRMEDERGPWKPRAAPEPRPASPAVSSRTPEEMRSLAAVILAQARGQGVDFRWIEEKGHFVPVAVRAGARVGAFEPVLRPYAPEVRAILDLERQDPAWTNPVPVPASAPPTITKAQFMEMVRTMRSQTSNATGD